MAGAFATVTIRTAQLSPGESADRQLGRADAIVAVSGGTRPLIGDFAVGRSDNGETIDNLPNRHGSMTTTSWARQLPPGTRITPDAWMRFARFAYGDSAESLEAVALDLREPMTHGIYRIRSGRAPVGAGEVAVTSGLSKSLRIRIGASVDVDQRSLRVVAIVENPSALGERSVVGPPAAFGGLDGAPNNRTAPGVGQWFSNVGYWLVDTRDAAPDLHRQLLQDGVVYETRDQWEHPAPVLTSTQQVDGQVLIVLGTVAGFGLLEVLLLAGAAFAVGTRRQTRELGLLAATGGDDTDIRRTVLVQGGLLGVGGAVIGVGVGILAVVLLRGVLEDVAAKRFGALDVAAPDLLALAVLGVVAGLLAAIVPARAAAARSTLQMLNGKFDADGTPARLPRWSIAATVGGAALTIVAAIRWHAGSGDLRSAFVTTGSVRSILHGLGELFQQNSWPAFMWLGAVLTLAGLVRACPAIVSRLMGISRSLPLSPRLAVRDAGRHRHRTAPAVAAVMTVVAGAILVLFVASSSDLRDKRMFSLGVPVGTIAVQGSDAHLKQPEIESAARRTEAFVGGGRHVTIGYATSPGTGNIVVQQPICGPANEGDLAVCQYHPVGVASANTIDLLAGKAVPAAHRILETGGAVVLDRRLAHAGSIDIKTIKGVGEPHDAIQLSALVLSGRPSYSAVPQIFVSPATAAAHGWRSSDVMALVQPTHTPSGATVDRAQHMLGDNVYLYLQDRFHSRYSPVLLAMLGAAAIATLAGTSIAVALAMAESRADMATMAAVGASPSRRRVHAMGQAAIVAGLGTGLGVLLGVLVALATVGGSERYPTSMPFRWLAGVVVVAPALAIAAAGLATRSRVTLTRRIA